MTWLGILLLILGLAACGAIESEVIVRSDEIGVLVDNREAPQLRVLPPGRYNFNLSQRIFVYPTFTQIYPFRDEYTATTETALATGAPRLQAITTDGIMVRLGLDVVFQINPDAVLLIHETWSAVPGDYRAGYIYSTVRIVVRSVISNYTVTELYNLSQTELQRAITLPLQAEFAENGFTLDRVNMTAVQFPRDVLAQLEAIGTPTGN